MYEALEFRHLRYFIAVAEHRTFSRAAERLHISQPAISAQIKQLEDALDVMLLVRGTGGNSVTPAGRAFLSFAKQLLELRDRAIKETSLVHSGAHLPFRFGYSPFINHELVTEVVKGYRELAPEGRIEPSSVSSGRLSAMVAARELDAALVSLPLIEQELFVKTICVERLVICLRTDDPLAREETIPRAAVQERLRVMVDRVQHPLLYDVLMERFLKAGIRLQPSDFVSAPSEMQYMVKLNVGFGLVRDTEPLDPELTTRTIAGLDLRVKTGFVCHPAQQSPILPLLAFRLAHICSEREKAFRRKKPSVRVHQDEPVQLQIFK